MTAGAGTAPAPIDRGWDAMRVRAAQIRRALDDQGNGGDFIRPTLDDDGFPTVAHPAESAERPGPRRELDPIPLVTPAADWARLGRALEQRAKVLELVLDDLFGPQRLLAGGHLPTDAVLTHREYLRGCVGIASPGAHRLVLYAADVARATDGTVSVLADRTQMPSGIGHSVQNREVMARLAPDELHEHGVLPIDDWLDACRAALGALAPADVEQPRIVMMTPGAAVRTHAEHAFLARTMGFTLVEPTDLTVRDARVWLKSVAGLEPVHVILRLVPSPDCDPLELRTDSVVGVPGLVEACRRQNVAVANPLGSGVGECAALLPFMPRLTRTLLGEEPLIESAPTWWCGDDAGRSHVLANLDRLLIRSRDPLDGRHTRFGRLMSAAELEVLARRIAADPAQFVGQEEVDIATLSSWSPEGVVERPTITRAFLVRDRDGYRCMEGGLTLTDDRAEAITFSTHRVSKDTWVTADGDGSPRASSTPTRAVLRSVPGADAAGAGGDGLAVGPRPMAPIDLRDSITSRAAESMFWLGRNLERCHTAIRLVRAVTLLNERGLDLATGDETPWAGLVEEFVDAVVGPPAPGQGVDTDASTGALVGALVDRSRERSLSTSVHYLLQNAASVRELFSADSWRLLTEIAGLRARLVADHEDAGQRASAMVTPLLALSGLVADSMVRDPGWRFLDIGRRLESAELVAASLGAILATEVDPLIRGDLLDAALNTWDGLIAYRRRYRSDIDPAQLVDFLVVDASNPRSLRSQVEALVVDLDDLPGPRARRVELAAQARSLAEALAALDAEELVATGDDGARPRLVATMVAVGSTLATIAAEIDLAYFVQLKATTLAAGLVADESDESDEPEGPDALDTPDHGAGEEA